MKEEIEDLTETVLRIATLQPHTRNSYADLIIAVWIDRGIIKISGKGGYYIPFKYIRLITNPESITRTYRALRETHPEIEESKEIAVHRERNEAEMHDLPNWFPVFDNPYRKQTQLFD